MRILPWFVAFSVVVSYTFNLTTTKWRFISLPDALNILRVATVLAVGLLVLDYIFVAPNIRDMVAPNVQGAFFLGKITIIFFWFFEALFLSALRVAYRYFRYTRVRHHAKSEDASATLLVGRAADAEILLRGIESGAVKRIWPVCLLSPFPAGRSRPDHPEYPGAGRHRRHRGRDRRFHAAQQADHARGDDAVGIRKKPRRIPKPC